MGNAVKKVWHGIKDVGDDIGHGVVDAGKWVGHTVEKGVDDVGNAAEDAAKFATHAVVDVGGALKHVVKFIPGIGGTLAKGIGGVTDLVHKGDQLFDDEVNAVKHPIDTVEKAAHIVSDPHALLKEAKSAIHTVGQVANDAGNVASAVAALNPEGGELLDAVNMARKVQRGVQAIQSGVKAVQDVSHGNLTGALDQAANVLPGKLGKRARQAEKLVKRAKTAKNIAVTAMNACGDFEIESRNNVAFVPIDKYYGFIPLVQYIKARHPGQQVTAHLFHEQQHIASILFR